MSGKTKRNAEHESADRSMQPSGPHDIGHKKQEERENAGMNKQNKRDKNKKAKAHRPTEQTVQRILW